MGFDIAIATPLVAAHDTGQGRRHVHACVPTVGASPELKSTAHFVCWWTL